jgi:hypothetical protein
MILTAGERRIVIAFRNGDELDPHDAQDAADLASLDACEALLQPVGW